MHGGHSHFASVIERQIAEPGLADAHRIRQHGLEDRLQPPRRTADHTENFRRSCLLLQELAEIVGALAQFVE